MDIAGHSILVWTGGMACAMLVGIAKTGVPGVGTLVVPLMALIMGNAKPGAGALLPLLCTADIFAVVWYRRHAETKRLWELFPWVVAGGVIGAFMLNLPNAFLTPFVGWIVIAMVVVHLVRQFKGERMLPRNRAVVGSIGVAAGVSTTVANAAGPVMNLYLLGMRLPREQFVATGAWFFFLVNLAKVPVYVWQRMITAQSLAFDAAFVPAVIAGAFLGRWLLPRIPQKQFERLVLLFTVVSALMLVVKR
jgi:uncharacterized protein